MNGYIYNLIYDLLMIIIEYIIFDYSYKVCYRYNIATIPQNPWYRQGYITVTMEQDLDQGTPNLTVPPLRSASSRVPENLTQEAAVFPATRNSCSSVSEI